MWANFAFILRLRRLPDTSARERNAKPVIRRSGYFFAESG